ncbi:hypothetical protein PAPYR_12973 [Paratrimastix pyriformis]|uniref:Uncharacterized protein n=1 Tax=Paratrimastix pyriformis TaxID=342808 RepID=A0ABQ8U3G1_9EUKA|nr:hypothetical protein PAPYR_12973 [Paratrimastix pyriformis]
MSQLESQPAEGLMDRAFPELEWKSILSNKVGTVYLQRLCLSLGVDYESPSKKTTLIAQLAPLLAERHFTPQKVLQILKLQSWIDISASGFQAPLITPPASAAGSGPAGAAPGPEKSDGPTAPPMQLEVGSTGERSTAVLVTPGEDIETLLEPNAPDDVLDDILWQVPADWYWLSRSGTSSASPRRLDRPPDQALDTVPGHTRTTAFASAADPGRVTNDDGQSCAYAATVQLLAGLRLRAPAQSRRRFGAHPSSSRDMPHIRARRGAYADASELMLAVLSAARRPDLFRASSRGLLCARSAERRHPGRPREHLPAGEQPGPLRVDKCSCGGQLRELSAVKPAPVLVVTVDKLAGVIARAFKTGRLEREGWPSFRLAAPGQQLRRPPPSRLTTKRHCPPRLLHPPQQHHRPRQHGPAGRPREQLLAPPVDRPASPADVSPSPSDQATTNTPEEEHQDHTGAPLNHNRPRSSEDFVIFYPGAARRWTRGPSPSLSGAAGVDVGVLREPRRSRIGDADGHPEGDVGQVNCRAPRHSRGGPPSPTHTRHANRGHRPAGHRPRGPFELYFPDGAPDGLTPAPTAVRTSREGQAWAVFSSLEDATAARAGASTCGLVEGHGGAAQPPARGDEPTTPASAFNSQPHGGRGARLGRAGLQRAAAATPAGATAIRAENTETDDEAGTDEAETGPRGATQRRRRARGDPAAEAPRGSH